MNNKVIGLDIGTSSVKVASIRREGAGLILESIGVAPAGSKGILSESLVDLQNLANSVNTLLSSSNLKIADVALSIPENMVYTKIIEMPNLSDQELRAALKFEMEQYVPLPLDKASTDWQILGKDPDGLKINVMLVASPISTIEKYKKLTEFSGLNAQVIETEIISVHRALLPLINTPDSNIIIHMGSTTTSVAVVTEGVIKIVFSVPLGGLAITRAISVDLGIDINQAENYKKTYGLNKEAFEGKIGNSLSPILESIVSEVKKTILSFKEKNNNQEIKQIVLSGGSSLLPGIDVYFTSQLGSQVVIGNCFSAYNIGNVPQEIMADSPSYNVVVGLALRNLI